MYKHNSLRNLALHRIMCKTEPKIEHFTRSSLTVICSDLQPIVLRQIFSISAFLLSFASLLMELLAAVSAISIVTSLFPFPMISLAFLGTSKVRQKSARQQAYYLLIVDHQSASTQGNSDPTQPTSSLENIEAHQDGPLVSENNIIAKL